MNSWTTLRVHYKTQFGDFISIRGSSQDLSWEKGLEATWVSELGEDVWVLSLPANTSDREIIRFKPLVNDEVWAKGYDYVVAPGEEIDIYPFFFATQGNVFKYSFHSQILGNRRKLAVYIPPSYGENPFKRYPIIMFQDGHNLFDTEDSFCGDTWQVGETLDFLSCVGGIQEYIVVGIYPVHREWEYLPSHADGGGGADKYLDMITHELRPIIARHLRTQENEACAIAGSSYGGNISLYAWATRPRDFNICGSFSPYLKYNNKSIIETVKNHLQARPADHKLYMDCGSIKDDKSSVIEMANYIASEVPITKEQFKFVLADGHKHTERHWAMRAPHALAYMFADPQRAQHIPVFDGSESDGELSE